MIFQFLSKNILRTIHWIFDENNRILFQLAGTWRIKSANPSPRASVIIIGIIIFFRVCLFSQQITGRNIVTDIWIFHLIYKSVLTSGHQHPRCLCRISCWRNRNFDSVNSNDTHNFYLNDWPNLFVSWNCAINCRFLITSGEHMFCTQSVNSSILVSQTLFRDEEITHFDPSPWNLITQNRVDCEKACHRSFKFQCYGLAKLLPVLELTPKSSHRVLSRCSSTLGSLFLRELTDSLLVHSLSLRIGSNPQLLRKYWADSKKKLILNNNSEFVISALKCIEVLFFTCFRIPRLRALTLVNTGWLVSLKIRSIFAAAAFHLPSGRQSLVPDHFHSAPGPIVVQWHVWNLCAYCFTCSEFDVQVSSLFVFVHSMSLNMDMKMILSRNCPGVVFSLCESFWICRRICNVVNRGKIFLSNSIASPSTPKNSSTGQYTWNSFTWFDHFVFASSPEHFPKTQCRIWIDSHFCHWQTFHLIMCQSGPCPSQGSGFNRLLFRYFWRIVPPLNFEW